MVRLRRPETIRWIPVAVGGVFAIGGLLGGLVQFGPCGDRSGLLICLSFASLLTGGLLVLKGLWPFLRG